MPYNKKFVLMSIFLCTINLIMLRIKMFFSSNRGLRISISIKMSTLLRFLHSHEHVLILFITSQMSAEDNSTFSCLYPLWVWMYSRIIKPLSPAISMRTDQTTWYNFIQFEVREVYWNKYQMNYSCNAVLDMKCSTFPSSKKKETELKSITFAHIWRVLSSGKLCHIAW